MRWIGTGKALLITEGIEEEGKESTLTLDAI